jgi:hypothetical protein
MTDLPDPGCDAFGEIAEDPRTALTELRVVLGVLLDGQRPDQRRDRRATLPGRADREVARQLPAIQA